MSEIKNKREISSLIKAISEYIAQESNRSSLITVTSLDLINRGKEAKVGVTVFPEHQENAVIDFLGRQRKDLGEFLKKKIMIGFLPKVTFHIDKGQKNSENILELIRKENNK